MKSEKCTNCGATFLTDKAVAIDARTGNRVPTAKKMKAGDMGPCRNCGTVQIFDGHHLREPRRDEWNSLPGHIQIALIHASRTLASQRLERMKEPELIKVAGLLKCPKCQAPFDHAVCQNKQSTGPKAGAMGLCQRCGEVLVFESSTVVRSAGPLEMARAPRELAEWSAEIKAMRKQN